MRQVYSAIQMMFFSIALSAIGSVISNIEALSGLGGLMGLIGGILTIVAIYRLKHENSHFPKAIRVFWIDVVLTIVLVIAAVVVLVRLFTESAGIGSAFALIALLLVGAVASLILALAMQYQTYAGFETLREVRQLPYPPKRIMWCFYLAIISIVVSVVSVSGVTALTINAYMGGDAALASALGTLEMIGNVLLLFGVLVEAIHLWLVFTYMQAAKSALDQETTGGWN